MEAVVVTLRATKPVAHRGKVLFINAVNEVAREQAQSFLRESHQTKMLSAYRGFADIDGFAAAAGQDQIAANRFSLAIPLYVVGAKSAELGGGGMNDALADWRAAAAASDVAVADVLNLLRSKVSA